MAGSPDAAALRIFALRRRSWSLQARSASPVRINSRVASMLLVIRATTTASPCEETTGSGRAGPVRPLCSAHLSLSPNFNTSSPSLFLTTAKSHEKEQKSCAIDPGEIRKLHPSTSVVYYYSLLDRSARATRARTKDNSNSVKFYQKGTPGRIGSLRDSRRQKVT
ncbi:hypothetical protein MPH_11683 [Macrophomina phaseolina MS6]|uniref:Uncharacterized protein n=1 Tax=Macrophomina phaseolina (strain MS6) TaxID=1126212 RepID=K2RE76_MACPH|nr:hypothetical protein MPH_11683 [Macrophomina phaseolina MS6]